MSRKYSYEKLSNFTPLLLFSTPYFPSNCAILGSDGASILPPIFWRCFATSSKSSNIPPLAAWTSTPKCKSYNIKPGGNRKLLWSMSITVKYMEILTLLLRYFFSPLLILISRGSSLFWWYWDSTIVLFWRLFFLMIWMQQNM